MLMYVFRSCDLILVAPSSGSSSGPPSSSASVSSSTGSGSTPTGSATSSEGSSDPLGSSTPTSPAISTTPAASSASLSVAAVVTPPAVTSPLPTLNPSTRSTSTVIIAEPLPSAGPTGTFNGASSCLRSGSHGGTLVVGLLMAGLVGVNLV